MNFIMLRIISLQSDIVGKIIKEVLSKPNKTRISYITATLSEKTLHSYRISQLMGFVDEDAKFRHEKLKNLIDYSKYVCDKLDYDHPLTSAEKAMGRYTYNQKLRLVLDNMPDMKLPDVVSKLFYIISKIFFKMEPMEVNFEYLNLMHGNINISNIIPRLAYTFSYQWVLSEYEKMILPIFREVAGLLLEFTNNKVIIYLTSYDNYNKLFTLLSEYLPIQIAGNVGKVERTKRIKTFQTDPTKRLIIVMLSSGKESISLDDQVGDQPRVLLVVDSYNAESMRQVEGRIFRRNTKSKAIVCRLYPATTDGHKMKDTFATYYKRENNFTDMNYIINNTTLPALADK